MRSFLLSMAGMLCLFCLDAYAIEVGSISGLRFPDGWTLDGEEMTDTRSKLLASSNFGTLGTVAEAITLTELSAPITTTALSTFDIFFIGYLEDADPDAFSTGELNAFELWVEAGGTMIITCDEVDYDAVCEKFGPVPSASNAAPPAMPTDAGLMHPIFDGPFGVVSELGMFGTRKYFENTAGFTVLAEDQSGNPIVLESQVGAGRVVVFTDVDMISNDGLSDGPGISNDNDRFLGNLVAYLADEAVETFFINAGINGNWWNGPPRSGEGVQLEVIISGGALAVVATFYSYDTAGNQIFLIAIGNASGNVADLSVFITEGPMWGGAFDPDDVVESGWGNATLTFSSCNRGHMSLAPNAQAQAQGYTNLAYELVRLTVPAMPCPISLPD